MDTAEGAASAAGVATPPVQTEQEKKREALKIRMHQLRNLLLYINTQLPNRKARRQFWNQFVKSEEMQVHIMDQFLARVDGQGVIETPANLEKAPIEEATSVTP